MKNICSTKQTNWHKKPRTRKKITINL